MPLISVNVHDDQLAARDRTAPLEQQLRQALAPGPKGAPVVVMIHGFRYATDHPASDPHEQILSMTPNRHLSKVVSWPRHLGFGQTPQEGLAVGFGWQARGTIWQAAQRAERAGSALAELVRRIRQIDPDRPVDLLAHSLGARVIFAAMAELPHGSLGRIVLMTGAEFTSRALASMHSPAGRGALVYNVTSRENDLFDFLTEALLPAPLPGDRTLGHGLPERLPNWIDLQIDQGETLSALAVLGHRIPPPDLRICHWSSYLRPGLFGLYRALLSRDGALTPDLLRAVLPHHSAPRWSRLVAMPDWGMPHRARQKAAL